MIRYALGNLFAKKVRTVLSLLLLTMVLAGTIGLISLSSGMRNSVSGDLSRVEGIVVIAKGSADPLFSMLPAAVLDEVRAVEGVTVAAPEIWGIVLQLDGTSPLTKGWFSAAAYGGMDPAQAQKARGGGFYAQFVEAGRFLVPGDERTVVMSRKLAREYGKALDDTVNLNGIDFRVVGIYHSGSMFIDQTLIVPLADARRMRNMKDDTISAIYVETESLDKAAVCAVAERIQGLGGGVESKTKYNWHEEFNSILGNLDAFFSAQSGYIAVLGIIIVLLTMTMSVMERKREFGILKAVGWTRSNVMGLVILESAFLGGVAGVLGCALGVVSTRVIGGFLPFAPTVPAALVAGTFAVGVALGLMGGLYPAWRAASLDPVEAMRTE